VLRLLRGVWRCRCRQVVTAERHLYGDRDPVLESVVYPAGDRGFESPMNFGRRGPASPGQRQATTEGVVNAIKLDEDDDRTVSLLRDGPDLPTEGICGNALPTLSFRGTPGRLCPFTPRRCNCPVRGRGRPFNPTQPRAASASRRAEARSASRLCLGPRLLGGAPTPPQLRVAPWPLGKRSAGVPLSKPEVGFAFRQLGVHARGLGALTNTDLLKQRGRSFTLRRGAQTAPKDWRISRGTGGWNPVSSSAESATNLEGRRSASMVLALCFKPRSG
jgi:hypothetical protein